MSLSDFLAKQYLNADTKPDKKAKKRKRKDGGNGPGLVIADDSTLGWEHDGRDAADEDAPTMGMPILSIQPLQALLMICFK